MTFWLPQAEAVLAEGIGSASYTPGPPGIRRKHGHDRDANRRHAEITTTRRACHGYIAGTSPHGAGCAPSRVAPRGSRRGVTMAAWPLTHPAVLWGGEVGPPRRGGILRVRGYDPVHFDPHLTLNFKTHTTLSFVYSTLVRYKVGVGITPGAFTVEPHLAERWEVLDDTTYVFHLRQGITWHHKPPLNGRELVAEDVQFTFSRFLATQQNPYRDVLESVVDR